MSTITQDSFPAGAVTESHAATACRNPALRGPVLLATDGTSRSGAAVIADGHGHGELRNSAVISPVVTRQYAVVSDSGGNVPF